MGCPIYVITDDKKYYEYNLSLNEVSGMPDYTMLNSGVRMKYMVAKNKEKKEQIKEQRKEKKKTISHIHKISWILAGIGIVILLVNRFGLYALTVNRMIFMAGILVLIFIPYITSLKFGGLDIRLEDKKDKEEKK